MNNSKCMNRRLSLLAFLITAVATACFAQPRFASNTETQELGQIEWKHPVNVQYIVTNIGDSPLVMTYVEPDCACTVAQWTQTPIAPGEKGEINVTFDGEALGHFFKSVAVYTNAEPNLAYLYFNGEVVRSVTDFSQTHPYQIGQLRIDRNSIEFPDVTEGQRPTVSIGVVNLSDQAYEPVLMHLPPYIEMETKPSVLQKGEKGTIRLTLHSERFADVGLMQTSVYLSRFAGDKVSEENELPVSVVLLPDFSALSEDGRLNAPHIRTDSTDIDLSGELAKKHRAIRNIGITNTGRSPLRIIKLQVFHPAVGVRLKKDVLQPGETARLHVTVNKKSIRRIRRHLRLLMITNDPQHPKVEINIKAQ